MKVISFEPVEATQVKRDISFEPIEAQPVRKTPVSFEPIQAVKVPPPSVEPSPEDLEIYRGMGLKDYRSPSGKLYQLGEREPAVVLPRGPSYAQPQNLPRPTEGLLTSLPRDISTIGQAIWMMTDPRTKEGQKLSGEILDRLSYYKNAMFAPVLGRAMDVMGILDYGELKKELIEERKSFAGFGEPGMDVASETGKLAFEWGWLYPKLFKLAGVSGKAISKIPRVKRAITAFKAMGGLPKFAKANPRVYEAGKKALGAFGKGYAVGGTTAGLQSIGEDKSFPQWLDRMNKRGLLIGGVATAFSLAQSRDLYNHVKTVRKGLNKAAEARVRSRLKLEMKARIHGPAEQMMNQELAKIDDVVSRYEAELLTGKVGIYGKKLPSAKDAIKRLSERGYYYGQQGATARGLTAIKGEERFKTGQGRPVSVEQELKGLKGREVKPYTERIFAGRPKAGSPAAKAAYYTQATNPKTGQKLIIPEGEGFKAPRGWTVERVPLQAPQAEIAPLTAEGRDAAEIAAMDEHLRAIGREAPVKRPAAAPAAKLPAEGITAPPVAEKPAAEALAKMAKPAAAVPEPELKVGEVELGAESGITSPAFNKHIEYFSTLQLPEKSQIRVIQKAIRSVNGRRLAGKITPQEAYKQIIALRKHLFQAARREGVSVRMTKGGKVMLAVRKAGTYAPEEFSRYGKFRNIYPLAQDISRSVQQIDGSLSIKKKMHEKQQAGAVERYVWWPTKEMSIQKLDYNKEKAVELKKILTVKKGSKEDTRINDVLEIIGKEDRGKTAEALLEEPVIKSMGVTLPVVKQAIALRKFYDDLIEEQNQARKLRSQELIPYRQNYSPHILRDATIWERMMFKHVKEPRDIFGDKAPLPDYIKPNKPFNPRELAREGNMPYEDRITSAVELAQNYLTTAAKDIFNTSIIQNNKAFIQQLETMGNTKAANFLADWTAEAYAGVPSAIDRAIKLTYLPKVKGAMQGFNRIRNLAVFPFNFSWNIFTQTSSLALTVGRYGAGNMTKGFYQWLQPNIRRATAKEYYSYVVKAAKQGRVTSQDAKNLIGQTVELRRTKGEWVEDIGFFFTDQLEKLLTGASIRAAYLHGQKRGLTGEALRNYASDGGAKTQSMYNDEDKPAFLRSVTVKTAAPYQTFAYEVMNTLREWAGRTGTPPDSKLYAVWSILRFLAAAAVFASLAKKGANKDVWSWKRPPIPFAEFWLTPIIGIFTKEYTGAGASGLTSPVQTAIKIGKGIDDVLETGSWRKLRNELIRYGPGVFGVPGGGQWSRTVDAIIAYSQGGVRDRRGRLLFRMKDPQDLAQGIFSGVWSTKGGREYLEKRSGKKPSTGRMPRPPRPKRPARPTRRGLR